MKLGVLSASSLIRMGLTSPRTASGVRFSPVNVFPGYAKNAYPGLKSMRENAPRRERKDYLGQQCLWETDLLISTSLPVPYRIRTYHRDTRRILHSLKFPHRTNDRM